MGQAFDVVWIAAAGALVFFMQAGFALLESGAVRSKNAVNVIMKNYVDMAFGALAFWAIGYGLMFGSNATGFFGFGKFFLSDAEPYELALVFFQTMFAATAATIVSGALAERIRYSAYIVCAVLITAVIYPVFGSWAWGDGGWLQQLGFVDFAGSTVVHSIGGWCALAGVIVLGPRTGKFASDGSARPIPGHNLPLVALGGFILWVGWFGFNGGSTLKATEEIGRIVLNTHLAGGAAVAASLSTLWLLRRPMLMSAAVNGGLAGLVAITAGCAAMAPIFAVFTGLIAGVLVVFGTSLLERFGWDDVVGAVPVHGVCGAWGTLAVGLFHRERFLDLDLLLTQATGVAAAFLWSFPLAWLMFRVVGRSIVKLRVSTRDEQRGLDFAEHDEVAYPEFQETLHHGGLSASTSAEGMRKSLSRVS